MSEAFDYKGDEEERQMFAEVVELETKEAMDYYTRFFASVMGLKVLEDMPPKQRLAVYMARPPILANGMPPQDEYGPPEYDEMGQPVMDERGQPKRELLSFPAWWAIAAEDQAYYQERVLDFLKLIRAEIPQ